MIQFTSRVGLAQTVESLRGLQLEVYRAVAGWNPVVHGPGPSIEDLASKLHRKEGSICGRLKELRDAGAIELGPIKPNTATGKPAMTYIALTWRAPETPPGRAAQLDLFGNPDRRGPGAFSIV